MTSIIAKYIIITILFILLDLIWFQYSGGMYNQTVSKIQGSKLALNIPAALITWFILSIGVNSFVDLNANILSRFATGALLGGVVYGVFNGTNKAIFEDYDTTTALYDTAWGMFVTGTVSAAAGLFV